MIPITFKLIPHGPHAWRLERVDCDDTRYFRTADQAHRFAREFGASRVIACDESGFEIQRGRVFGINFGQ